MSDVLYKRLIHFFVAAALLGCGAAPHKADEPDALADKTGEAGETASHDSAAGKPAEPLTTEVIYNILVGEIALQRTRRCTQPDILGAQWKSDS